MYLPAQFGMLVSVVEGMVKSSTNMDRFTFAGILNACQRANKAEVAFEILRYSSSS